MAIQGIEKRQCARKDLAQGVLIERTGLAKWMGEPSPFASRYMIRDIGAGGVCFENHRAKDHAFVVGDSLVFQVKGAHVDSFRATGKVAWTTFRRKNAAHVQMIGISFKSVPGHARKQIEFLN